MKYDAGMKQFHGDIVAAVRLMCGKDTDAHYNSEGASPAPLRDYLKKQYGYNGKCSNGVMYSNTPSKGMEIKLDREVNNDSETSVTLSWSQVAKFIRDNASEIFGEEDSSENAENSSPIEAKTYLEIFKEHYPNVNCNTLYDDYCPGDFFKGATEVQHEPCTDECENCWNTNANEEWRETADCVPEKWKAAEPPAPAPAQSEPTAFDYTVLDTDTAASLRNCETIIRTETAGYFTLLGAKFKEAQDLLANHSSGTFEQWYTAMGFKRQTVYNLIKRFEFSSSPTIGERAEVFEALPLTLSYEISKPDAPAELVDKVLDGDITSNAEYQKLKKQLEETTEQLEQQKINNQHLSEANDNIYAASKRNREDYDKERLKTLELQKRIEELESEADEADREYDAMADRECQHETLISDLKRQIKELESRPVEVAVQPDEEALAVKDKLISELKEEIARLSDNGVKNFVIRLTLDEYVQLQDIVKTSGNLCIVNAVNSARMIKL